MWTLNTMKTQRHENVWNNRDTKYLSAALKAMTALFCNIVSKAAWRTARFSLSAIQCNSLCRWMPVNWLSIGIFRRHHWCCQKSWAVFPGTIPYHATFYRLCCLMCRNVACCHHASLYQALLPMHFLISKASQECSHRPTLSGWQVLTDVQTDANISLHIRRTHHPEVWVVTEYHS